MAVKVWRTDTRTHGLALTPGTFNRELMRLADLERVGHVPRSWKTYTRPGTKRQPLCKRRRRRRSVPVCPRSPSTSSDDSDSDASASDQEGSLSPLRRPISLPPTKDIVIVGDDDDDTEWTGSIHCGDFHFVSEWVIRVARLIIAEGFLGDQEMEDVETLQTAKTELTRLRHGMALDTPKAASPPPPPPYANKTTAGVHASPSYRARALALVRTRSHPEKPPEKPGRDKDDEKLARAGVSKYLRRLLVG